MSSDHSQWLEFFFFFQAEDGIRYLVRSRGLGDVYKRQAQYDRLEGGLVMALHDSPEPVPAALRSTLLAQGLSLIHI